MPPSSLPLTTTALPRLKLNAFLVGLLFFALRLDLYRWIKRSAAVAVVTVWNIGGSMSGGGGLRRRQVEWAIGWIELALYLPLILNILESTYILISTSAPKIVADGRKADVDQQVDPAAANGSLKGVGSAGVLFPTRAESPAVHRFLPSADAHPPLSSSPSSLRSRSGSARRSEASGSNPSTPARQRQAIGGSSVSGLSTSTNGNVVPGGLAKTVLGQGMATRPIVGGGMVGSGGVGAGGYAPGTPSRLGVGSSVTFAPNIKDGSPNRGGADSTINQIISPSPHRFPQPLSARQMLAQSQSQSTLDLSTSSPLGYGGESLLDLNASASSLSARARLRSSLPGLGPGAGGSPRTPGPSQKGAAQRTEKSTTNSGAKEEEAEGGGIDPLLWSTFQVRHNGTPDKNRTSGFFGGSPGRSSMVGSS